MIYVVRVVIMLLVFEVVACGYLLSNKMLSVEPAVPAFYLDDPLLRRTFEKLSRQAQSGNDLDWQHLAEALLGQGYYAYAESNYREALKLNPDNVEARFGLAFCLDKMGRTESSTREYRIFLEKETRRPESQKLVFYAKYAIGRNFLREEKLPDAEKEFRENSKFIPANYQLAKLLIRSERAEEALPLINKNLKGIPFSLGFHFLNYLAMQELNRPEQAQAAREMIEKSAYLVSLNFNNDYIDPFYMKYGQERNVTE